MRNWRNVLVKPTTSIKDTIATIDRSALKIALVVDADERLLGTVTDGDIRRGILRGLDLDRTPVREIMNPDPLVVQNGEDMRRIAVLMKERRLHHLPLVDERRVVQGLVFIDDLLLNEEEFFAPKENWVVLMAGGLGTRLRPLTDDCPKPMLKVGKKPILEIILDNFCKYGFKKFYFSVNYKAEVIRDYFGDGSRFGVEIKYLFEEKRLGTAGPLSLIPETSSRPLIVMNGDLLTNVNFNSLLDYHLSMNSVATMCVREYDYQIPYGVVKIEKNRLVAIEEKPVHRSFVSAGIYVLNDSVLELIPKNEFYDMPTLFEQLIADNRHITAFPITEYWCDIGRLDDYHKANLDYEEVFG